MRFLPRNLLAGDLQPVLTDIILVPHAVLGVVLLALGHRAGEMHAQVAVKTVVGDAAGEVRHGVHRGDAPGAAGQADVHGLLRPGELAAPGRLHDGGIVGTFGLTVCMTTQGVQLQGEAGVAGRLVHQNSLTGADV